MGAKNGVGERCYQGTIATIELTRRWLFVLGNSRHWQLRSVAALTLTPYFSNGCTHLPAGNLRLRAPHQRIAR